MEKEAKQEVVIYGILWFVILTIVPVIMFFQGYTMRIPFRFGDLLHIWLGILPFFVLFLFHDFLATPLLLEKRNLAAYIGVLLGLTVLFAAYIWASRVVPGSPPPPGGQAPPSPGGRELPTTPEVLKVIMGLLMMGVNVGVKYYMKSVRGERRMQELQAENLGRQLETLRYQINPHFFMNTLNNIHALVDIDPEQAKASIEEFSKMMRHVLYEGDHRECRDQGIC